MFASTFPTPHCANGPWDGTKSGNRMIVRVYLSTLVGRDAESFSPTCLKSACANAPFARKQHGLIASWMASGHRTLRGQLCQEA